LKEFEIGGGVYPPPLFCAFLRGFVENKSRNVKNMLDPGIIPRFKLLTGK
jgi:hypothetical protein